LEEIHIHLITLVIVPYELSSGFTSFIWPTSRDIISWPHITDRCYNVFLSWYFCDRHTFPSVKFTNDDSTYHKRSALFSCFVNFFKKQYMEQIQVLNITQLFMKLLFYY